MSSLMGIVHECKTMSCALEVGTDESRAEVEYMLRRVFLEQMQHNGKVAEKGAKRKEVRDGEQGT